MDSVVAAQLETMSGAVHAIPALREDIEDLRVWVEEFTERIDELLKRSVEPNRNRPEDNQVPPPPEPEPEPETAAWELRTRRSSQFTDPPFMIRFSPGDALRRHSRYGIHGEKWRSGASIDQHLRFRRAALKVAASEITHVEKVCFQSPAVAA
jgi:hypothetical protein